MDVSGHESKKVIAVQKSATCRPRPYRRRILCLLTEPVQLQCSVVEFCASCEFDSHTAFLDKSDSDDKSR